MRWRFSVESFRYCLIARKKEFDSFLMASNDSISYDQKQ